MKKGGFASGFTLIEILIYAGLFAAIAIFLVETLISVTRVQSRQTALNELNQQISFVASTIERLVRNSSLIENTAGVASTSLVLRMPMSASDPTTIFTDVGNTAIYVQEGKGEAVAITNALVKVGNFQVTKYENPGGRAVVQVDFTLRFNSENPRFQFSRTFQTAIGRVSAANFDSSLIPTGSNFNIGSAANAWNNAYFSGAVGIGTSIIGSGVKLGINTGNIAIYQAGGGLIVKTPDGNACYQIGVTNAGVVTSTLVACP